MPICWSTAPRGSPSYYIDTSVLLEITPLIKFIRNYIRDSSGIFSISSLVKISMISLISSLSLKLFFNLLVHDRNMLGSSWKVFSNLQKFLENVRQCLCDLRTSFRESSECGQKSSENRQKCHHQDVYMIKRTLHVS